MANVNCDVIKDLLPLYVDQVVSDSTRELVIDHLASCQDCTAYEKSLKEKALVPGLESAREDKAVIQRFRKSIIRKRLRTALITAAVTAVVACALIYLASGVEWYIPYEKSGLTVRNGILVSDLTGYHLRSMYPEVLEEGVGFIYAEASLYDQFLGQKHVNTEPLLKSENLFELYESETADPDHYRIRELYYVPKEYTSLITSGRSWQMDAESAEEAREMQLTQLVELKSASLLIWKLDD